MEKKAKLGLSPELIVGFVFTIIGGVFLILGVCLPLMTNDEDAYFIGLTFGARGLLFLVIGGICLCIRGRKQRRMNELLQAGYYIWGKVVDSRVNHFVTINNRSTFVLMVEHVDESGTTHYFKTRNLLNYKYAALIGQQVKIYVDRNNYDHYFVDLDGLNVNAVEH